MGDIFAGGVPLLSRRYGSTEIIKVYVGEENIWPPLQRVTLVGSIIGIGSTSTAFLTHQSGDLLVVATVAAGATPPALPVGWNSAHISPATDTLMACRLGWKIATAAGTSNPTWSGQSWQSAYVFRGADPSAPFGAIASKQTPSNTTGIAPAITPINSIGESMLLANLVNNGTAGSFGTTTVPAGWISKNRNARVINNQRVDSRLITATSETLVSGGSVNWRGLTFEVLPNNV